MFYVSSIRKDGMIGVTDTEDSVEEFYAKDFVLDLAKKVEIDGVDLGDNLVCVVRFKEDTIRLFKQGEVHLGISTMTLKNDRFGLKFKSKPSRGELSFVSNQVLNISREGVNSFSFDLGRSKSYRSGLTLDDILMVLERFNGWKLVDCNIGGY